MPGWTTIAVLLAIFNGITIALLSMLGEYVVRTLNAVSAQESYHVTERVTLVTRHLLVIGGQRCGTTYLHGLLDEHPEIAMARPARPEPKVFLSDELSGRGGSGTARRTSRTPTDEKVLGEKSTSYLEDPLAADPRRGGPRRPAHRACCCATRSPGRSPTGGSAPTTAWRRGRWTWPSVSRWSARPPGTRRCRRSRPSPTWPAAGTPTTSPLAGRVRRRGAGALPGRAAGRRRRARRPLCRRWASTPASVPAGRDRLVNGSSGPAPDLPPT